MFYFKVFILCLIVVYAASNHQIAINCNFQTNSLNLLVMMNHFFY
jgi:hypothetical protein